MSDTSENCTKLPIPILKALVELMKDKKADVAKKRGIFAATRDSSSSSQGAASSTNNLEESRGRG